MSVKDNFTADEWFKVMSGPGRAGAAVVAASPSGVTGLIAEMQAIAESVRENVSKQGRTPLMEAMAADLMGKAPRPEDLPQQDKVKNMDEAKAQSVEGVRQAIWVVSSKASPEDTQAYRDMLMQVVEKTAQAAKEGGFLGMGGEQINDKERAVMAELQELIRGTSSASVTPAISAPSPDGSGNSN
ncbi:hypothetical protein [Deinococcus fonticola]|uniref:hypothetical protein n=1 Tax=Deinococcus fonticola TaxID=2528713 RepID=UPI0010757E86|nr:hypothetical protein [Deinococcus fonticola]